MPIESIGQYQQFPTGLDRVEQQQQQVQIEGDPFAKPAPTETPGWGDTLSSMQSMMFTQGVANMLNRPAGFDPAFNPFRYIKENPHLADDPMVMMLMERGQFDGSTTEAKFNFDYQAGLQFMNAADTWSKTSYTKATPVFLASMLADPLNLIPAGGIAAKLRTAKMLGEVTLAARAARVAASMTEIGAATLLAKKIQDEVLPAGNEPGMRDDAMVFAFGATLGGLTDLLARPVSDAAGRALSNAKVMQLRKHVSDSLNKPVLMGLGGRNPLSFTDEVIAGRERLREKLNSPVVEGDTIRELHMPGDETDKLIQQLKQKYLDRAQELRLGALPKTGKQLSMTLGDQSIPVKIVERFEGSTKARVHTVNDIDRMRDGVENRRGDFIVDLETGRVESGVSEGIPAKVDVSENENPQIPLLYVSDHPSQQEYKDLMEYEAIIKRFDSDEQAVAGAGDLQYRGLDKAANIAGQGYMKVQDKTTFIGGINPGARLANNTTGIVQSVYRLLSASAQTVTAKNARGIADSINAETVLHMIGKERDTHHLELRGIWRSARRSDGPINYNGGEISKGWLYGYEQFLRSVTQYRRALRDKHLGFDVEVPTDVHPAIMEAADASRRFYQRRAELYEEAGMLDIGPRAIAESERQISKLNERRFNLQSQLDTLDERAANQQTLFNSYTRGDIAGRLDEYSDIPGASARDAMYAQVIGYQEGGHNTLEPSISKGETFAFTPDDFNGLTKEDKARLMGRKGGYVVNEDAAEELRQVLGEGLYNKVRNEMLSPVSKRDRFVHDVLESPEQYDPQTVIDAILYDHTRNRASPGAGRNHVIVRTADLHDGMKFSVFGLESGVGTDSHGLREIHIGDYRFSAGELDHIPVDRDSLPAGVTGESTNPRHLTRAERLRRQLETTDKKLSERNDSLAKLKRSVDDLKYYVPRHYDVYKIMEDESGFKSKLKQNFYNSDSIVNGKRVAAEDRPLLPEVIDNLENQNPGELQQIVRDLRGESVKPGETPKPITSSQIAEELTEGLLPKSIRNAYLAELDAYYARHAESAFSKLTDPSGGRHGMVEAMEQSPVKRRLMTISERDMERYLTDNMEDINNRYHHKTAGDYAVRRAIMESPEWRGATLRDGTAVTDSKTLMRYVYESFDSLQRFAGRADTEYGRHGTKQAILPSVQKLKDSFRKDIEVPLAFIEGRNPIPDVHGVAAGLNYFGRLLLQSTASSQLGGMAIASLNDFTPLLINSFQRPQTLRFLIEAIRPLKSASRRDLELAGLLFDQVTRTRSIADTDSFINGPGIGYGTTRNITAMIERGAQKLGDLTARITCINWLTDVQKRWAGLVMFDRITTQSKRLLRAREFMAGGMGEVEALRKVGLNTYDVARLAHMGIDEAAAREYLHMTWQYGLDMKDNRINSMSFDDFLKSKDIHKPNIAEWPSDTSGRALRDRIAAGINGEVVRSLVVTPGVFDSPLWNMGSFGLLGKVFNQFQAFPMAFTNQRLRVMAQMPAKYQLWYIMSYMGLGTFVDAISNQLSGRRSIDETMTLWANNPLGMTYAAVDRSGMLGWIGRPLGIADALRFPLTPGNLSRESGTTASRHVRPGSSISIFGPSASQFDRMFRVASDVLSLNPTRNTSYNAAKLLPFQNLFWLRALHQTTGAPVVPEAIISDQFKNRKPTP